MLAQSVHFLIIPSQLRTAKSHFRPWSKSAVSIGLTLVVFLQLAMGAWQPLHKYFHQDADQAGHECAVTLFTHGQVDASAVDVPLVLPAAIIEISAPAPLSFVSPIIPKLPPGRGPPALCLAG